MKFWQRFLMALTLPITVPIMLGLGVLGVVAGVITAMVVLPSIVLEVAYKKCPAEMAFIMVATLYISIALRYFL